MNLYQLRDMQVAAMTPMRLMALMGMQTLENPLFARGDNAFTQSLITEMSFFEKHARIRDKPSFGIQKTKFRAVPIAVKEKIVTSHPFCNLLHFERVAENESIATRMKDDPKVLIIPPLSGHFASILRDTVESMLPAHDVYVTDWIDAKKIPVVCGFFDLEGQISYLADIIRFLGPNVHLLCVTQASFSALAAVALLSARDSSVAPRSITLIGGPIDARESFVPLHEMAQKHNLAWFKAHHIELVPPYYFGAFRPVYPGFLQLQNRMALALDNRSTEIVKYFQHLVRGDEETDAAHEKLYDEFLSVMDVPAELYLQFIDHAYCKCSLAKGEMKVHGKKINLASITKTALLTIEAELDDLSPPGQTRAAIELCTGLPDTMKQAHLEIGVGHYGIFSGKKWRCNIQPVIYQFIRQHAQSVDEVG